MILINLFFVFFKIGLFTIGGGLAALPLLQEAMIQTGWVTESEFFSMFAISQSTPGPIGLNMATYCGYKIAGLGGAVVATTGMITPCFIIALIISKFMLHIEKFKVVQDTLLTLRAAVSALIVTVVFAVFNNSVLTGAHIDFTSGTQILKFALFLGLIGMNIKYRLHPVVFLVIGAVFGIVFL
ncbi:MAG: chromate transporter [Kiritimatiellae bacterium]|jgi:chromate transporter|nr:chromate transporter [Kiritimatiellia bacterium]